MSQKQNKQIQDSLIVESNKDMHKHLSCNHVKEIRKRTKYLEVFKYIFKTKFWPITVIGIALLLGVVYLYLNDNITWHDLWSDYTKKEKLISTLVQLVTFIAVSGIWLATIIKEWQDTLPKYLSGSVVYKDRLRIRFRFTQLISETDARGMAQSFAKSLNCGGYLDIAPSLQNFSQYIAVDKNPHHKDKCLLINRGMPFIHYEVTIALTQNLTTLCKGKDDDVELEIPEDKYILWDYPFIEVTKSNLRAISK